MRISDPRHEAWLVVALVIMIGFGAIIAWDMQRSYDVPPVLDGGIIEPVYLDVVSDDAPCSGERYELACERWQEKGWDRCIVGDTGIRVSGRVHLLPEDTRAGVGFQGTTRVLIHPDGACNTADYTIEHEVGHLFNLDDDQTPGSVMNSQYRSIGNNIPLRSAY